jgi:hypothetical protein
MSAKAPEFGRRNPALEAARAEQEQSPQEILARMMAVAKREGLAGSESDRHAPPPTPSEAHPLARMKPLDLSFARKGNDEPLPAPRGYPKEPPPLKRGESEAPVKK